MENAWDTGLPEMFAEARAKNLWFFCHYQHLWFSPDELAKEHANGKFCWGAVNWKLRDPQIRMNQLREEASKAMAQQQRLQDRIDGVKP